MLDFKQLPDGEYTTDEGIYNVKNGVGTLVTEAPTQTESETEKTETPIPAKKGSSKKEEKPKKKRKWKWFAGALFAVTLIGALTVEEIFYGMGWKSIKNFIINLINGNPDKNTTEEIQIEEDAIFKLIDTMPIDQNGILSITHPLVVKPLEKMQEDEQLEEQQENEAPEETQENEASEETQTNNSVNTFYSLPLNFGYYYVYDDENQVELIDVTDDPRDNENVQYWQTTNNSIATGYVGVQSDYREFLEEYDRLKSIIKSGEKNEYSTPLEPVDYQVSNLYKLPDGYELYCENPKIKAYAKLAYIDYDETDENNEHYSNIYQIPSQYIDNFIGVTKEAYNILTQGDNLRAQLVEVYEIYSQDRGNMGYEETTGPSR